MVDNTGQQRICPMRKNVCFWCIFGRWIKICFQDFSITHVLLHNGNRFPSVPLAHAANMKENYESMKLLLGKIKYDEFKWKLCGDLKVLALVLWMQLGYTKYCCFLCEWDSRNKKNHYVNKLWSQLTSLMPEEKNVVDPPLVLLRKFVSPFAHKAGLREKLCERYR